MAQWAGAGAGAAQGLEAVLERRLKEAIRQQEERQHAERLALETRQVEGQDFDRAMRLKQFNIDELRRVGAQNQAGLENRGHDNLAGLVDMGLDPQTLQRESAGVALRGRMGDPLKIIEGLTKVPPPERDPIADYESKKKLDRQYDRPVAGPRPERDPIADHEAKLKLDAKYKTGDGTPSPYSQERATRTLQSVDELIGKVNRWTTGVGSVTAALPESSARNFKAELDTLKANVAFNELTAMREASKTGGALGAISDKEMQLLSSALGALDQGQSPENIKAQLGKIKESVGRWQAAGGKPIAQPAPAGSSRVDELLKKYGGKS